MRIKTLLTLASIAIAVCVADSVQAQTERAKKQEQTVGTKNLAGVSSSSSKSKSQVRNRKSREPISIERRQELLLFVREHHPELEKLMKALEKNRPEKYRSAVRALNQSFNRIRAVENEPARHEIALRNWKLKSRIDLQAARIAIKDSPEQRAQLRDLIAQFTDNRTVQLRAEKKRVERRIERIEQQLTKIEKNRDQEIDRQVELAIKKIRNSIGIAKSKTAPKKPGSKKRKKGESKDPIKS